jgi:NADH:ubiquinone oxidoreductase subunit K
MQHTCKTDFLIETNYLQTICKIFQLSMNNNIYFLKIELMLLSLNIYFIFIFHLLRIKIDCLIVMIFNYIVAGFSAIVGAANSINF